MTDTNITLHGYYYSSTSYRTRILLNLKNLDYKTVEIRLDKGAQHADDFTTLNPMGAVPVLEIDGQQLIQSPAISDYIEEHYTQPKLLPEAVGPRQRVREITALIACDIHPVNNLRVLKHLRNNHDFDDAMIATWYAHWIKAGFSGLEKIIAASSDGGRYCVGDAVSMADVFLIPQVANARRFNLPLEHYPTLMQIDTHCRSLEAFAKAHPDQHTPADKV